MVRCAQHEDGADAAAEVCEEHPAGGVGDYVAGHDGVWFTGLPRAGRWREILGRFSLVRAHADDPMRVVEFAETEGRVKALRLEIVDRRAGALFVLRHTGAPFSVRAID